MLPRAEGSIRLFRLAGIQVYLHWSWFIVAVIEISSRSGYYSSPIWNVFEYLALFIIVLMHEFGHATACRQVGGKADEIILWPFGGVAFVAPPPRPGPILWSIAAGPLVNVILAPILTLAMFSASWLGWGALMPNAAALVQAIWVINLGLLVFNILPIYPLDGGQILQSLLWFGLGRGRSLTVAVWTGFVGVAGLLGLAWWQHSIWIAAIAIFIFLNCRQGLFHAKALSRLARLPRRQGFACPDCKQPPIRGAVWRCGQCSRPFDPFETKGNCPYCGTQIWQAICSDCGATHSLDQWSLATTHPV